MSKNNKYNIYRISNNQSITNIEKRFDEMVVKNLVKTIDYNLEIQQTLFPEQVSKEIKIYLSIKTKNEQKNSKMV